MNEIRKKNQSLRCMYYVQSKMFKQSIITLFNYFMLTGIWEMGRGLKKMLFFKYPTPTKLLIIFLTNFMRI